MSTKKTRLIFITIAIVFLLIIIMIVFLEAKKSCIRVAISPTDSIYISSLYTISPKGEITYKFGTRRSDNTKSIKSLWYFTFIEEKEVKQLSEEDFIKLVELLDDIYESGYREITSTWEIFGGSYITTYYKGAISQDYYSTNPVDKIRSSDLMYEVGAIIRKYFP